MRKSVERISRVLGLQNPIEGGNEKSGYTKRKNSSNSGVPNIINETPAIRRQLDLSNMNQTLN